MEVKEPSPLEEPVDGGRCSAADPEHGRKGLGTRPEVGELTSVVQPMVGASLEGIGLGRR